MPNNLIPTTPPWKNPDELVKQMQAFLKSMGIESGFYQMYDFLDNYMTIKNGLNAPNPMFDLHEFITYVLEDVDCFKRGMIMKMNPLGKNTGELASPSNDI